MKKLDKFLDRSSNWLNTIFTGLIAISFFWALQSSNWNFKSEDTTIVSVLLIFGLVALLLAAYGSKYFAKIWRLIFVEHARITIAILTILLLGYQLMLVFGLHPAIGFDVGQVHASLTNPNTTNSRGYFSQNFNNVPVLLFYHAFAQAVHSTSWLAFDLLTLFLVDLSCLFNVLTMYLIHKWTVKYICYLEITWLFVFPYILVPYTDTLVLPFSSFAILALAVIIQVKKWYIRLPIAILGAFALAFSFLIKPSSIAVPVGIAVAGIIYLMMIKHDYRGLITILISFGIFLTSSYGLRELSQKQNFIQVNEQLEIPAVHFLSMGISGKGGYNPHDALMMAKLPKKSDKVAYSWKKYQQRLKSKGFFGYLVFLFKKQGWNTADGTFAWLIEGHFTSARPDPSKPFYFLQELLYPTGKDLQVFRLLAQIWWICVLAILLFGYRYVHIYSMGTRLGLVVGMIFLLLFEGGRSRYLIQFLPGLLMLASLLYPTAKETILDLVHAVTYGPNDQKKEQKNA